MAMRLSCLLFLNLASSMSAFQAALKTRSSTQTDSFFQVSAFAARTISIDENAYRDMGGFDVWATQNGVLRENGFSLTQDYNGDISVMTTQDCPPGTRVLHVPTHLMLSSSRARAEFGNVDTAIRYLVDKGVQDQISQFYLMLKILLEYERGEDSPWYPWMDSLPRRFYNAVSMTDMCYECLPPFVYSLSKIERVKFDVMFEALQFVEQLSRQTREDVEVARWAFSIVYTRCWGTDGEETQIVPMADLFNHGEPAEAAIQYDDQGNCNIYVKDGVPAGSPLRLSYGSPTNPSRLMATFGFLDETAPASFCKIMVVKPSQQIIDIGYDFSRMLFYRDGSISEEVWDVVLYSILDAFPDYQQAFYEAHMRGDPDTKNAIHGQFFLETANYLKKHVDTVLWQIGELSKKAEGQDEAVHPRLPMIKRHNAYVKDTFLRVKEGLDPLVEEELARRQAAGL